MYQNASKYGSDSMREHLKPYRAGPRPRGTSRFALVMYTYVIFARPLFENPDPPPPTPPAHVYSVSLNKRKPRFNTKSLNIKKANHEIVISG